MPLCIDKGVGNWYSKLRYVFPYVCGLGPNEGTLAFAHAVTQEYVIAEAIK